MDVTYILLHKIDLHVKFLVNVVQRNQASFIHLHNKTSAEHRLK